MHIGRDAQILPAGGGRTDNVVDVDGSDPPPPRRSPFSSSSPVGGGGDDEDEDDEEEEESRATIEARIRRP